MLDPLYSQAEKNPSLPALIDQDTTLSFSDYHALVSDTSFRLREAGVGVQRGDRVGLILRPSWQLPVLICSLFRVGAVACPISPRLPLQGAREQLQGIQCRWLIADEKQDLPLPSIDTRGWFQKSRTLAGEDSVEIDLAQDATILFTSGSSAKPKAALHCFGNHYHSALGSNENLLLSPGDRWLFSLPLHHVAGIGILMRCMLAGAAVVIPNPSERSLLHHIEAGAITHLSVVPTQLKRLLKELGNRKCPSLKAVLLGGAPCPERLLDEAYEKALPLYTSYGMTEMSSQITTTAPIASGRVLRSSGALLNGRELATSADAEILVKGATLFKGYVSGGDLLTPFDTEGWFHTGDLGHLDEEGFLHVMGRKDRLFISGGENIQPEEIEAHILRIEGIRRAVVVPEEDEEFGHRPVAFVEEEGREFPDAEKIRSLLEKALPRFKIPTAFYPWSQ